MAQALFDEHPLEQYLRNAGEGHNVVPGSTAELESELDPWWGMNPGEDEDHSYPEWRPPFMIKAAEVMMAVISALDLPNISKHSSPFVEQFKYDVISSSLLAVSLPSTYARTPRSPLPGLPGQLNHSRTSSISTHQNTPTPPPVASPDSSYLIPSSALVAFALSFHAGNILLAIASLGITVYTFNAHETPRVDMSSTLDSLNDLIASSNEWETVVQTALDVLDSDEQNSTTYGAATPPSPSSLCVALHSSLLTTQTQCDNVRQLFSALTLPSEVSQLSEMYAPPSPVSSSFFQDGHARPLSLPSRRRTLSMPADRLFPKEAKRQTWNGTYSRLGQLGSPDFKQRVKRRSDLSSLLQASTSNTSTSTSAPTTPAPPSLPYVNEESDTEYEDAQEQVPHSADEASTFGAAALAMHRKHMTAGMEAFRLPPAGYFSPVASPRLSPLTPRTPPTTTYASGSRFTPIQAARHPLSLSALHHALQSALASKRFACSHLLALRFADEEDDGYWEDVRSVMGLLTSTLVDASSRLSEALVEVEQQKLRDQNPTPSLLKSLPASEAGDKSMDSLMSMSPPPRSRRKISISFAPLPSNMSRFAAHVEAITSALNDAKENLQECVSTLRQEETQASAPEQRRSRRVSTSSSVDPPSIPPALEAYERLRRELGLALRECERGRERLLDVVYPPDPYAEEDDYSGDDIPALGHDGSDESDKPDPAFPFDIDVEPESPPAGYAVVALEGVEGGVLDDATSHLLLSASTQHLPPPGIEQVFEADSGSVGMFTRERSKLTREERIKLAKARRESGGGVLGLGLPSSAEETKREVEKWGPGGEVVQELKDVIWKVGERRRRMADATLAPLPSAAPSGDVVQLDGDLT